MSEIPYYLRRDVDIVDTPIKAPVKVGTIDLFDYDNLADIKYGYEPTSIWESLGESADQAGNYVWDSVSGAWTSVKTGIEGEIAEKYSVVKWEIVFWLGTALLIIFVVARTGILGDVAKIVTLKG